MQFEEVIRRRHMVRRFSSAPVSVEVLHRVLEAARRGPSAGFCQGLDLLVLDGAPEIQQFFELTSDPGFLTAAKRLPGVFGAPVIVVPLAEPGAYVARYSEPDKASSSLAGVPAERWPSPYWLVDSAFSVMLLLLAATDNGLGALFFRLHRDPAELLARLGVPEGRQVIGAVALGYEQPGEKTETQHVTGSPALRPRRSFDEMIHKNTW